MLSSSAFDLEDDDKLRRLLYLSAFMLFFLPYFQAFTGLWPFHLGDMRWRFQAAGSMSGILLLPFLGLSCGAAVARSVGHKGISCLIGTIAALTVVAVVCGMGLFFLDSLQLKAIVKDAEMANFVKAVGTAAFAMMVSICAFSYLSLVAFGGRKGAAKAAPKTTKKAPADEPVGLLIGQDFTKQ